MLIFNGVVHPVDAPVIPNGYVELEGGKIKGVGPIEALPKGCEGPSLDVKGGHIVPGFVDAHCHLGLFGDALKFEGDDGNEATNPCTPHVRAIDGVNPLDRCFQEAREGGVTTVLTGPGSANPISGQGIVIKTLGAWVDQMVLKAPATMKMALGENPKTVYNGRKETPTTRMGTASVIRTELARALEYMDRQDKADTEAGTDAPGYDPRLEALIPVLRGELPVHIHAHRADDIATAVRICREYGLQFVVVHGTEGYRVTELLAAEGVGVITGPILTDRSKPELAGLTIENPARLADRHLHRPPRHPDPVSAPVRGHCRPGRPGAGRGAAGHYSGRRPIGWCGSPCGFPDAREGRRRGGDQRPPAGVDGKCGACLYQRYPGEVTAALGNGTEERGQNLYKVHKIQVTFRRDAGIIKVPKGGMDCPRLPQSP